METNKSALLVLAKSTLFSSDKLSSVCRVINTSKGAFSMSRRNRSAMSNVMSFSDTPDSEMAPCCLPPCPGSITILLTERGRTARFIRYGVDRGAAAFSTWPPTGDGNFVVSTFAGLGDSFPLETTSEGTARYATLAISKETQSQTGNVRLNNTLGFTLPLRTTSTLLWTASRRMRSLVSSTFSTKVALSLSSAGSAGLKEVTDWPFSFSPQGTKHRRFVKLFKSKGRRRLRLSKLLSLFLGARNRPTARVVFVGFQGLVPTRRLK